VTSSIVDLQYSITIATTNLTEKALLIDILQVTSGMNYFVVHFILLPVSCDFVDQSGQIL